MNEPTRDADALTAFDLEILDVVLDELGGRRRALTTKDPRAELALQALDRHRLIRYVTSPSAKDSSNRRSSSRPLSSTASWGW